MKINDATMNFSGMADTARQIQSLSLLVRIAAANDSNDSELVEDAAVIVCGLAEKLRHMIEDAEATALEAAED